MNLSLLLGVLGILATVAFGAWGLIVAFKLRYPGCITFVREECLSLFDDIVKDIPDLSVQFRAQPVKEDLVLLKGAFINTGAKDITESMVAEDLCASLPEGFRWVEARVVDKSEKVSAEVRVEGESRLRFRLGLFRCDEFMRFQGLVEMPTESYSDSPSEFLLKKLQFSHRIADTRSIEKTTLTTDKLDKRPIMFMIASLIMFLAVSVNLFWFGEPVRVNFRISKEDGSHIVVKVRRTFFGKLIVRQVGGEFRQVTTSEDFFSRPDLKPTEKSLGKFSTAIIWIPPLFVVLGCVLAITLYLGRRSHTRLRKLLTKRSTAIQ